MRRWKVFWLWLKNFSNVAFFYQPEPAHSSEKTLCDQSAAVRANHPLGARHRCIENSGESATLCFVWFNEVEKAGGKKGFFHAVLMALGGLCVRSLDKLKERGAVPSVKGVPLSTAASTGGATAHPPARQRYHSRMWRRAAWVQPVLKPPEEEVVGATENVDAAAEEAGAVLLVCYNLEVKRLMPQRAAQGHAIRAP
ncbi:hypothetical protein DQ04_03091060 [Trypanosoma grayi]|uniref:hypothetical protein n=1 Tax=Trypanosoma grayi TaxID=71804 RepID=UPI0004F40FAF|nr:hypothetical protein DQ04_03091060 [Trypanosoma grayi]KEG10980.1 hypothetical protein DQ04_03091060 [Trypanosoma grayi]